MLRGAMTGAAAAALLLAGCSRGGPEAGNATAAGDNAQDLTPEGPGLSARLFGRGKPVPLQVQATHPAGVVLQLTSVQAKPTETVVGVLVINGDTDEQVLNQFPTNHNAYLLAGDGERLLLSPPQSNPELRVGAGQRMQGELVFLGRLEKGAGATLVLNDGSDVSNKYSNSPGFRIALPLTDAAFSDDGSKKNGAA